MLPKNGVRPQLIPEHEINCLSSPQVELLYEYMLEDKVIDPVRLDLCEYQAIDPIDLYHPMEEEDDAKIEVSPYEALVINDISRKGAIDSLPNPEPQQETLTADQIPHLNMELQNKQDMLISHKKEINLQDMDHWSVFTEQLRYTIPEIIAPGFDIQGQGCLDFSPERLNRSDQAKEVSMAPLEFHYMPASEYLDRYNGITSELKVNMEYDDAVDVTTTYLGHEFIKITDTFHPEQAFPIYSNCHTHGQFVGGGMLDILLDTGASKSYMSKAFYMRHPHLHKYPKFNSTVRNLQVGNGELVATLFVIPFVFKVGRHLFEVYTLVSEIQQNMDIILGVKNMFEIEGEISCRTSQFKFLNRSLPIFPLSTHRIKIGAKAYVKAKIPFIERLSGHAIIKLLYKGSLGTMKIRLVDNLTIIQIINNTASTMYLSPEESIGIVDLRSLGYYNIRPQVMHFNLTGAHNLFSKWNLDLRFEEHFTKIFTQNVRYRKREVASKQQDPYPWLDEDDPRRKMTDEEILYKYIDLSESHLTRREKEEVMDLIITHKKAFSLRDEIGKCPDIKVNIEVNDPSTFFVRPFPIAEEDKPLMDKCMQKLVSLGILSKNSTTHTSPVMLVARKGNERKRPVVDFRLLNTRIVRRNTSTPLLRDIFIMLGRAQCEVLSCVDLKEAFHSLPLTSEAKEFCGILPYFGSPHFRYEVLPMGLAISPQVWIDYIENILCGMADKQDYIAIMDDLLVHGLKDNHLDRLEALFKAMVKHGLKLSPKKCQLFMKHLTYMGNVFHINGSTISITPLQSRIEAIQKLQPPTNVRGCKSFCGVVNYLSIFCRDLQKLLKPIYDLTKKGRPFIWQEEQQQAFDLIKERMVNPPILHLPKPGGRFILYCDSSRTHTGSSLWQIQEGKPKLIGYASKSLPAPAVNYSVTELEMTGMAVNIHLWRHLLHRVEFDCAVDHRAIPYIMKAKTLPATTRIMRLLEILSGYAFNLYFVKGKDMKICDFLSRIDVDRGNPGEVIPISFNSFSMLNTIRKVTLQQANKLLIATRSSTKAEGTTLPPVHGIQKHLDPAIKPEHDKPVPDQNKQKGPTSADAKPKVLLRPRLPASQIAKKRLIDKSIKLLNRPKPYINLPKRIPQVPNQRPITQKDINIPNHEPIVKRESLQRQLGKEVDNPIPPLTNNEPIVHNPSPIRHFEPNPLLEIPQQAKEPQEVNRQNLTPNTGNPNAIQDPFDTQMEVPFSEDIVEPVFKRPDMADFEIPPVLEEMIPDGTLIHRHLPKQSDLDKILTQINRKYLRKMHLPCSLRDMQAAYMQSPHFCDIYNALMFNRYPKQRRAIEKLQQTMLSQYIIQGGLLYIYIKNNFGEQEPILCVPPSKIDIFLDQYHTSLLGGHSGITKCYQTLKQRIYCPNLPYYVRLYIISCHICQLFKGSKKFDRPLMKRFYDINTPTMTNISMDIKHMPPSKSPYKYILVLLCDISNFLVATPMKKATAEEVCSILFDNFMAYYAIPKRIICDQDPAFMSSLCQWFFKAYGIQLITVSPTNHKSLQAEHGIKSLSSILMKHLSGLGDDWHLYTRPAMLTYNTYNTPNLDNLSPFELALGRKPILVPRLENTPHVPVTGTFAKAKQLHEQKLKYLREKLQKFRDSRLALQNKDKEFHGYTVGQIVYMYHPRGSLLQTASKKIKCEFVGPLAIYKCVSPNQFLLTSLDGYLYPFLVEETRIKPGFIPTTRGNVSHLAELKKIISSRLQLQGI